MWPLLTIEAPPVRKGFIGAELKRVAKLKPGNFMPIGLVEEEKSVLKIESEPGGAEEIQFRS